MILQPKGSCQSRFVHLDLRIDNNYSKIKSETHNLFMKINWNGPQNEANDLATKGNFLKS